MVRNILVLVLKRKCIQLVKNIPIKENLKRGSQTAECNMKGRLVVFMSLPGIPQPASPRENQPHRDLYKL